jgi:transcriptional regulator of acetoin/glycerol metabolism
VLESKEVHALGAARAHAVDVRVCSATHDLRAAVAAGRFREDLFFRVGRPEVTLPALRDRAEEIPWLVEAELSRARPGLAAHVAFVEACLCRRWPGNVRELLGEVRRSAHQALAGNRNVVDVRDLASTAGIGFDSLRPAPIAPSAAPDRAAIEDALRANSGNVTGAARALGVHRNQLRRLLAKTGIDPKTFGLPGPRNES